jgi:hypothetical protein
MVLASLSTGTKPSMQMDLENGRRRTAHDMVATENSLQPLLRVHAILYCRLRKEWANFDHTASQQK